MKKTISIFFILVLFVASAFSQKVPDVKALKIVAQNPFDKAKFIAGVIFHDGLLWCLVFDNKLPKKGLYATFDPQTDSWELGESQKTKDAILAVSQPYNSPSGIAFAGKKLWISGSYGRSFGVIDTESWKVEKIYEKIVRPDLAETNSQSYADMTFDGKNIWIAWHLYHYRLPDAEVQQLLKIDPENGEIVEKFPLPVNRRNSPNHGLTFDGETLWHIKGKNLSNIDLNGNIIAKYILTGIGSPSGMAFDGESLWISVSKGKLWKLPLSNNTPR